MSVLLDAYYMGLQPAVTILGKKKKKALLVFNEASPYHWNPEWKHMEWKISLNDLVNVFI